MNVLDETEIVDSDDDFAYDEVDIDDADPEEVEEDEDLESALMRVRQQAAAEQEARPIQPTVGTRPELIDDFIRNFLLKMKMTKTLDSFQTEWYEKATSGQLTPEDVGVVADVYQRNQELDNQIKALRAELDKAKEIAHKARSTWDKFRKERDFHRMNHRRVVQEKSKLVTDLRRLRAHLATYEPTLKGLEAKYEVAMKEKAMAKIQSDRLALRVETLENQLRQATMAGGGRPAAAAEPGQTAVKGESSAAAAEKTKAAKAAKATAAAATASALDASLLAFQVCMPHVPAAPLPCRCFGLLVSGHGASKGSCHGCRTTPRAPPLTRRRSGRRQDRENPYLSLTLEPQRADR